MYKYLRRYRNDLYHDLFPCPNLYEFNFAKNSRNSKAFYASQGSVLKKKNHHDIANYLLITIITEKTVSRYFFTSNKNLNNSYT